MVQSIFQFDLSFPLFYHWTEIYCTDFRIRYQKISGESKLWFLKRQYCAKAKNIAISDDSPVSLLVVRVHRTGVRTCSHCSKISKIKKELFALFPLFVVRTVYTQCLQFGQDCIGNCQFDNNYLKDFSSLLSLDLFLVSSLDFVKNPQWIQVSGTVQETGFGHV